MVRTQIYLTEDEQRALRTMARETGKTQSELIRLAVDRLLERQSPVDRRAFLRSARGMWSERGDLPDLRALRDEWDRYDRAAEP